MSRRKLALLPGLAVAADAGGFEDRLDVLVEVVGRRGGRKLSDAGGAGREREAGGREHRGEGPHEHGAEIRHRSVLGKGGSGEF